MKNTDRRVCGRHLNTGWTALSASLLLWGVADANTLTGIIDTLQVHPPTNGGYVRLTGLPTFDATTCSGIWAKGDLDNEKFMIYIWPLLVSAKNQGKSVTINVVGCSTGYPVIDWIQVNPT
jgi:hypothetical protein